LPVAFVAGGITPYGTEHVGEGALRD
jgi:hypothetical protein